MSGAGVWRLASFSVTNIVMRVKNMGQRAFRGVVAAEQGGLVMGLNEIVNLEEQVFESLDL